MQFGLQAIPPVGIVLDSDFGNEIDDVLALALLYGLDGRNECRAVGTTISKPNLKAAALCDAIGRFYAGEVSAAYAAVGRTLPVGLATKGSHPEDTPMLAVLARQAPDGKPVYRHGIGTIIDTADPVNVLRNALSAQHAKNTIIVLTGPATNLASLLRYPLAHQFIPERCRFLVIAGGSYPAGKPDPGFQADIASARKVLSEWPTPIIVVGQEVGEGIPFPAAALETRFSWSNAHPVVDAYRAWKPMPYDAPTTAMAAVLYAVRSKEQLFQLSEPGVVSVSDDGSTKFTASDAGRHRYLKLDPAQREKVEQTYVELASAKPVPKLPRRRFGQQQQQQQEQPKPPQQKPLAEPRE